ncbi:MAG: hypothetical protein L3V56_11785 [Candidatus Magnetoovum sp. WYHC-5]|nr:hypothetical protein [Candidatus Magnetoovum sp. WYHC-5]
MKEITDTMVKHVKTLYLEEGQISSLLDDAMGNCDNSFVCMVMEIARRDAFMHSKVAKLIVDSMEKEALHLSLDDFAKVSDIIRKQIEYKEKAIQCIETLFDDVKDKGFGLQRFLLTYVEDTNKQKKLFEGLQSIKRGLSPYWVQ